MKREEAIKMFELYLGNDCYTLQFQTACSMAIAALREQDNRLESDTVKVVDSDQFKTNADHIRSMTDEELAKLLLDGCRGSKCEDQPENEWGSVNCFRCRMDWLKQPH